MFTFRQTLRLHVQLPRRQRNVHLNSVKNQNKSTWRTQVAAKIGFIGDGNMAKAICRNIIEQGVAGTSQIHVSSPYIENLKKWETLSDNITTSNAEVASKADVIFLGVKPYMLSQVVEQLKQDNSKYNVTNKLFVSILAGITVQTLEKAFSFLKNSRIIRAMPNTPMIYGVGCTLYCPGTKATTEDITLFNNLLAASGLCEEIPENMVNPAGAVSGCGPAFIYLVIEALSDGAVKMGVPREMATRFAAQTVLGAAQMVLMSGKHTGQLKDQVCSAGGTTISGMHELEKSAVRGAFMNAVEAAAKKAEEFN